MERRNRAVRRGGEENLGRGVVEVMQPRFLVRVAEAKAGTEKPRRLGCGEKDAECGSGHVEFGASVTSGRGAIWLRRAGALKRDVP